MSVYAKESPKYLQESMMSMFSQTISTDDFVLVCDGPLTKELDMVIAEMRKLHSDVLRVVRLKANMGLGNALKEGLVHCKNELVARMDSDDISLSDRCEKQLAAFKQNSNLDILSGTIEEFSGTTDHIIGRRQLPATHEALCRFSRKRNPFNHPAVMFKKTSVLNAGNYTESYHLFEDYDLWIRMLMNGCYAGNIQETIVYMRTSSSLYQRRGGKAYAQDMLRFHRWMRKNGWVSWSDYLTGAIPHALVCLLPNWIRKTVYVSLRGKV